MDNKKSMGFNSIYAKILFVLVAMLILYRFGYIIGKFIANSGF